MIKIFITFILLLPNMIVAQLDDNMKAKLYFLEAEKHFNENNYEETITYVEKSEKELGTTFPMILRLKVISYYRLGKFIEAEKAFNLFVNEYQSSASKETSDEILSYFVRIEKGTNEFRKEKKRKEEEKKIIDEKRQSYKNLILKYGLDDTFERPIIIKENDRLYALDKYGDEISLGSFKIVRQFRKDIDCVRHDYTYAQEQSGNWIILDKNLKEFTRYGYLKHSKEDFTQNCDYIYFPSESDTRFYMKYKLDKEGRLFNYGSDMQGTLSWDEITNNEFFNWGNN